MAKKKNSVLTVSRQHYLAIQYDNGKIGLSDEMGHSVNMQPDEMDKIVAWWTGDGS